MGCNCCRLCHSYAIETDGVQGNGYVNEALSCPPSVKDWSRTQTITITDLLNEEQKKLERDRLSGLQDPHAGEEKNNEKNYEIDPPTYILDLNSHGENNYYSSPTDTPRQQDNDLKRISEEPECFQHQFINSAQKTSSLTESAILDVLNDDLLLKHSDHKSGSPTSNQEHAQKSHGHPPEVPVSDHKSVTVLMCEEPIVKDKSSLVALMLARNSLRGTSGSTVHPQNEDLDPDVAEALAALAAALAGEYFEDS